MAAASPQVSSLDFQCVVCVNSTSRCSRCEIRFLKHKNYCLEQQVQSFYNNNSLLLDVSPLFESRIDDIYKFRNDPIDIHWKRDGMKFVTITFDPQKFGLTNDRNKEQNYILYIIWKYLIQTGVIDFVYGCFELHKNGNVHTHTIMHQVDNRQTLFRHLKRHFTDRPRNKRAVDVLPAIKPNSENYINKVEEYQKYYYLYDYNNNYIESVTKYLFNREKEDYDDITECNSESISDSDID